MIEIGAMIRSTVAKKCRFRSLFAKDNMQGTRPQRIFPVGSGKDTIYTDRPSQAGSGCSVIGALFAGYYSPCWIMGVQQGFTAVPAVPPTAENNEISYVGTATATGTTNTSAPEVRSDSSGSRMQDKNRRISLVVCPKLSQSG
jgi:hypothetical protein